MILLFNKYNIVCCSETWLSKDFSDTFIQFPGKKLFRSNRNGRGGGVCVFIDSNIAPYCEIDKNHTYCNRDLEIISISVKKPGFKHMFICVIYRPPRGNIKNCIDQIQEYVRQNSKNELWLLGDFNVDFLDRNQPSRLNFIDLFKKYGCRQLISNITRPGRHKSSCLDWIVTNSCFVIDSGCLDAMISDHFPVSAVRKKNREHVTYVYRDIRDYTNYNPKDFTDLLRTKLEMSNYMNIQDPNVLWDLLHTSSSAILEIMCPVRRFKQREFLTPWMYADIFREMRFRDRLVKNFRQTRTNYSLCALRRQRNIVNSKIETAKKNYIQRILNENVKNPRKFWKLVNELLHGRKCGDDHAQFIDPSTNDTIPFGSEAEFLNSYFCNIIDHLGLDDNVDNNHYRRVEQDLNDIYGQIDSHFELVNDLITVGELEGIIPNIDITKSSSISVLSTTVCKDIMLHLPREIVYLFNASLLTCIFPRPWSKGTVTVIPKSGNLSDPTNWRPLTQTPIFAKIFEKLIHSRILSYFNEQDVLTAYQYGFRPERSTQEAIFFSLPSLLILVSIIRK